MKIAASLRAVGVAALAAAAAGGVNACASEADGGGMVVTQNAPTPTVCPMIYLPVCGREATGTWKTYGNDCEAKAAGATAIVPGPCKPSQ